MSFLGFFGIMITDFSTPTVNNIPERMSGWLSPVILESMRVCLAFHTSNALYSFRAMPTNVCGVLRENKSKYAQKHSYEYIDASSLLNSKYLHHTCGNFLFAFCSHKWK